MTILNKIPLSVSDLIAKFTLSDKKYGIDSNEYDHSVRTKNRIPEIVRRYFPHPSTEILHYLEHLALLHDVVESRKVSLDELSSIYPKPFILDLDYLTRREGETYADYKIRLLSSKSFEVYVTKLADNFENSEWTIPGDEDRVKSLSDRYRKMRLELLQALDSYKKVAIVSSPWSKSYD